MKSKDFADRVFQLIESESFIWNFSDFSPSSNKWEQWRQLEYWIHRVENNAKERFQAEFERVMDDQIRLIVEVMSQNTEITPFKKHLLYFSLLANVFGEEPDFELPNRGNLPESVQELLPQEQTLHERFMQNMETLWADPRFWEIHHEASDNLDGIEKTYGYIKKHYGMDIQFPPVVWQQMLTKPRHKHYLLSLMCSMAGNYFQKESVYAAKSGIFEATRLDSAPYMEIIEHYLCNPSRDLKGYLAARNLPVPVLKILKELGKELNENARWCLKTGNQYVAEAAKNLHQRQPTWKRAMTRERMILLIKKDPELASKPSRVARSFFGMAEERELQLAREAINLHEKRECFDSQNKYKGWDPLF
jgi:hypothetical protein